MQQFWTLAREQWERVQRTLGENMQNATLGSAILFGAVCVIAGTIAWIIKLACHSPYLRSRNGKDTT
jgi:hypothetical protein